MLGRIVDFGLFERRWISDVYFSPRGRDEVGGGVDGEGYLIENSR